MRILLIEDDSHVGSTVHRALIHEGYTVDWFAEAEQGFRVLKDSDVDVAIVDWMLPGLSGLSLIQRMREAAIGVPVLMLTANVGVSSKVTGLDAGADDYLTKPFELDELLARIRALGRRKTVKADNRLTCGSLVLDPDRNLIIRDDREVMLSSSECRVLKLLMVNRGRYVSKGRLEDYLTGWGEAVTPNAIEAHISRLRKRVGRDTIVTLRGVGYKVAES